MKHESELSIAGLRTGHPQSFGFVRRSDLELGLLDFRVPRGEVWESPEGDLIEFSPGEVPLIKKDRARGYAVAQYRQASRKG